MVLPSFGVSSLSEFPSGIIPQKHPKTCLINTLDIAYCNNSATEMSRHTQTLLNLVFVPGFRFWSCGGVSRKSWIDSVLQPWVTFWLFLEVAGGYCLHKSNLSNSGFIYRRENTTHLSIAL